MNTQTNQTDLKIREVASFAVSDVPLAEELLPEIDYETAVSSALKQPIEACSGYGQTLVDMQQSRITNPFMMMLHQAYAQHRPIAISPDHIWLLICHGFAAHVNNNAEELRHQFVEHEGKKKISVFRPDFTKGNKHNPWEETFPVFCSKIKEYVGEDLHNAMVAPLSTTTAVEKAAFELSMMDAMQEYFHYHVSTLCGIPHVTLEGTVDDWQWMAERIHYFRQFDLDWWVDALVPIFDKIVDTANQQIDINFWKSIYKRRRRGSGGSAIHGWITQFFPYIKISETQAIRSRIISATYDGSRGLSISDFPAGLRTVPFTLDEYQMKFASGFVGITQDPQTSTLRSEIGWAVMDALE